MHLAQFRSEQSKRKINLVFQILLVLVLYFLTDDQLVPGAIIVWQFIHFVLIAISDYYLDDHPHQNKTTLTLFLCCFSVFLLLSIYYGIFNELYVRIHIAILILGNLFGGKIDKPFWKILTYINIAIIVTIEIVRNELIAIFGMTILYTFGAICLLAIAERLSEKDRNFWMIHALILFVYILLHGPFYQEAFIFLVGGISYECSKLLINRIRVPSSSL